LSFFDEADEPAPPTRSGTRPRQPSGRGRPPHDQQAIQTRRTIAVVVAVVVIVLLAVGVHSCDVSQTNSALRDYANSVASIMGQSNSTGHSVLKALSSGGGANRAQSLQSELTSLLASSTSPSADSELQQAENLSVPGQMQTAQQHVLFALRMRRDGVKVIADQIQQALGTTTNRDAVNQIATATARFYASDVIYKAYAAPEIAAALNAAGIQVGGTNGPTINAGQFLTDLGWLNPSTIAGKLGSNVASGHTNTAAPGLHGDSLTSVAVGSNTMAPGVTNHVAASPPPTFTLSVANGGQFPEYNIGCKVTITGLGDTGTSTLQQTTPGQTSTCSVTLPSAPTPGTYSVTASVAGVPGEKNLTNNSQTFTVQFQ
jgi:hypothetical protein